MTINKNKAKGFTLLELLIVIAILAVLSVTLVLVLNPSESLKKSRDTQRMSDLATLKTAIGLYMTTVSSPDLDAAIGNHCYTDATGVISATPQISYSAQIANPVCTGGATVLKGADGIAGAFAADFCRTVGTTGAAVTDGTGWVPINLNSITGGSPISNLPLDPTNTIATPTAPVSTDLVYRYACQMKGDATHPSNVFEIDAVLESDQYGPAGTDDKSDSDGGDNADYYEVGSSVKLIGTGTNF